MSAAEMLHEEEALGRCVFVPLVGRQGFPGGDA